MKSECTKWRDHLLESALLPTQDYELQLHLAGCEACAQELESLKARREKMDALLPLVARGGQPSEHFAARIVEAGLAGKRRPQARRRMWDLAWLTAVLALGVAAGLLMNRGRFTRRHEPASGQEVEMAEKLTHWRAPSDALLTFPGPQVLHDSPRLGETYITIPLLKDREE
jgi:anti-sigma factor RsiW